MNPNQDLLSAVRTVGIVKPRFNPVSRGFDQPQLDVKGTGFWLSSGVFITCAHVVEDLANQPIELTGMLTVGGNLKPYRKATISIIDYPHDLAVLFVESNDSNDASALQSEIREGLEIIDSQHIDVGENIAYAGFPFGSQLLNEKHSPSYAEGVIGNEALDEKSGPKMIQISGPVVGGYSGAPIVTKRDYKKLVGVVSHSPSIEAGQASIFNAVHWRHVKELVDLAKS